MGLRYSEDCGVIVSLYVSRPAVSELKRQKYTYWCHSEFCRTSSSLCQLHSHFTGVSSALLSLDRSALSVPGFVVGLLCKSSGFCGMAVEVLMMIEVRRVEDGGVDCR
jgi:hypothetical protein